jgi:hypothetical protein
MSFCLLEDNKHKDIMIYGKRKKLYENEIYQLACTKDGIKNV